MAGKPIQKLSYPEERAFSFLPLNQRETKPRRHGVTEIRGPYYTPMGRRYLEDVLETMGSYVDVLKFAGGSFSLTLATQGTVNCAEDGTATSGTMIIMMK